MSGYPKAATDELRFALAGPAVTFAIAAGFGVIALLLPASTPEALTAVVSYQLFVNATILVFNLLPAFPLDGGRVLRALIWRRTGDLVRATHSAASVGRGLGYGMVGLGVFTAVTGALGGLWLALIGLFVTAAAKAEENGLLVRTGLGGREAGKLMSFPAITVPAQISVAEAISDYFIPHRFSAFPVLEDGRLIGLVDTAAVERVPVDRRASTSVGDAALYDPELVVEEDQDVADLIERPAFQRVGRAVVRAADGRVGILSITEVNRVLRALDLGGQLTARPRAA
jgi:CBS domain-containing protein